MHKCTYSGKKLNLYKNGTILEFNDLFKGVYPNNYKSLFERRPEDQILKSFGQYELNYKEIDYNNFTLDTNN